MTELNLHTEKLTYAEKPFFIPQKQDESHPSEHSLTPVEVTSESQELTRSETSSTNTELV